MPSSLATFLMFDGTAEDALDLYRAAFPDATPGAIERFAADEGQAGKVKQAALTLQGQRLLFFDSPIKHAFDFTPSMSLFVECANETEFERVVKMLSAGGETLMPVDNYGFSTKYTWFNDRFGVSWQVNLQ